MDTSTQRTADVMDTYSAVALARDEVVYRHRRAIEREGELAAAATARAEAEERMAQAIERRRIATLRSVIASCPGHRAAHTSEAWGYVGSVSREENRAAHGAVGYTDTCSCGAQRRRLVNGPHVETEAWGDPIGWTRAGRHGRRRRPAGVGPRRTGLRGP